MDFLLFQVVSNVEGVSVLDHPRGAHGRLQHAVRRGVVELLFLRVPTQFLAEQHGNIGHVAHGRRVMAHFDGGLVSPRDLTHSMKS